MADVFISYSSRNRNQAAALAGALTELGLAVWWDREILAGEAFDRAIERELEGAKCVVVLWSADSVDSEWVKNEAAAAAERGVLLPASLDGVKLPLEFRRKQTADLGGWAGDRSHEGFQSLYRGIQRLLGRPAAPAVVLPPTRRPRKALAVAVAVVAGVGLLAAALFFGPWTTGGSKPAAASAAAPDSASAIGGLADKVVGSYLGDVVADSQGSSRSHVVVTLQKTGANSVRASSPYARIGSVEIELTQVGQQVVSAAGSTTFIADLGATQPTLSLNPRGELAYHGVLQK